MGTIGTSNHVNVVGDGLQVVWGTIEFLGYGTSLCRVNCIPILLFVVCIVEFSVRA